MADDAQSTEAGDAGRHPLARLPNALTLARIGLAPAILGALLWASAGDVLAVLSVWTGAAAALLVLAGALDWIDGRLARALKAESAFGRFWDPIADKLVIAAALIGGVFVVRSMLFVLPAALLLWRDVMVTWLRTQPRTAATIMAPTRLAKWKTTSEYAALITLLGAPPLAPLVDLALPGTYAAAVKAGLLGGLGLLWLAAALSLWTGWRYFTITRKG